jgi:maleate isomerase
VGVVVPAGNPAVEPEIHALISPVVDPYACRFPAHAALDLAGRLASYVGDTPAAVDTLAQVSVQATYIACTGSSYSIGADGNRAWIRAATAVTKTPVATAAAVVAEVLRAATVERVRIVSPYPRWLGRRCTAYWNDAGFHVVGTHDIVDDDVRTGPSDLHPIYGVGQAAVTREAERALDAATSAGGHADAVVIAGTGVATVEVLDRLVTGSPIMLVSANVAAARWLLLTTGHPGAVPASAHPSLASLPAAG